MKRSRGNAIVVEEYKKLPAWAAKENSKESPVILIDDNDEQEGEKGNFRDKLPKWFRNPEEVELV
jgi:hypothetical protein